MSSANGNSIINDVIVSRPSLQIDETTHKLSLTLPRNSKDRDNVTKAIQHVEEAAWSSKTDEDYPPPTEAETQSLRKVAEGLPFAAYSLCFVELAERASYYGARTVFSNFVQFPLPKGGNGAGAPQQGTQGHAGALGMGLQAGSGFTLLFTFLAYVIPLFGGWWADVHVGRFKAILVGVLIAGIAHIIQIIGAIPSVLQRGTAHAAPPFIIGLFLLAVGAGLFKPNITPLILDQHQHQKPYIQVTKSGEKVIVDPEVTVQRTMLIFYGFVNAGAFFPIATTYSEKYVGFWLAFLESGVIYFLLPIILAAVYSRIRRTPPAGARELALATKITGLALKKSRYQPWKKGFWDAVKPSTLAPRGISVDWTDALVQDVRRALSACEIFFYFPIWWMNNGGIGTLTTNQGASMTTNGAPNDLLHNFNALTIIVSAPTLAYVVYPLLRHHKIKFGRISRITFGFLLAMISGVIGTLVQWRVYQTSPCGNMASTCDEVSPLSIWWQIPNVSLGAISECFCNVTAYELAYARAPPSMRGLVVAIHLFTNALNSALGSILLPVTKDPYLIWIWASPVVALAVQTVIFWYRFRHLNNEEYMVERKTSEGNSGVKQKEKEALEEA